MYHLFKGLYLYATSKEEYSILLLGLDNAGKTTLLEQIKSLHSSHAHPNLKTVPTVGQNVATCERADCYLKLWDVGGQHSLRGLWQSYYASCHAIVFVIDSTDVGEGDLEALAAAADAAHRRNTAQHDSSSSLPSPATESTPPLADSSDPDKPAPGAEDEDPSNMGRLSEARLVLSTVLAHTSTTGIPLLVLANKQDREDCVEVVRIKEGLVRPVFEEETRRAGGGSIRDSRVLPCSALTGAGVQEAVEWLCTRVKWNREVRPPVMR